MFKYKMLLVVLLFSFYGKAQVQTQKEITDKFQSWFSLNTVNKVNDRLGIVADVHLRTDGGFKSNNFYFIRAGVRYFTKSSLNITAGYAHLWLAPTKDDWTTYSDEQRIYEQIQWNAKAGNVAILQRIRNEQRWVEKIVDNKETGENRFTNRVRYLLSFNIPIFKNKKAPELVLSDEVLFQFGSEVVYNTFDQNRFFVGIKQAINPNLSFDFGYMNVYQEKFSGYQYDMNHTLRLFFYLNTSMK